MAERENIWQSRSYMIPRTYMRLIGIWPYHTIRVRYLLFVPMFIFSISILVPQVYLFLLKKKKSTERRAVKIKVHKKSRGVKSFIVYRLNRYFTLIDDQIFCIHRLTHLCMITERYASIPQLKFSHTAAVFINRRGEFRRCVLVHALDSDHDNIQLQNSEPDGEQQESTW